MAESSTYPNRWAVNSKQAGRLIGLCMMLLSALIYAINTHHGIGVEPDTTRYMRLGPMPFDAPLYAWALDALRALGIPFGIGAWSLGLLLVCANTQLTWKMLVRGTDRWDYAAVGTALIILSPQFVRCHRVAMSEPLFLFVLMLAMFAFLEYVRTGKRGWLMTSAAAFGLTMLARFSAAPLAVAIALLLLFSSHHSLRSRVADIAIFAAISGCIFFGWVIQSQLATGQSIGRDFVFYGNAGSEVWLGGIITLTAFMLPLLVPMALRVALLLSALGSVLWLFLKEASWPVEQRDGESADRAVPIVWGLFAALYVPFIVLSISMEANLTIGGRYVLPFYIALVISGASLAARHAANGVTTPVVWFLTGLSVLMILGHLVRTIDLSRKGYAEGIEYNSMAWKASSTVGAVRALPADAVIFCNAPDALNFLTPRKTRFIPLKTHPRTGREDPTARVSDTLSQMRAALAAGNGYVVFLDAVDWRSYAMTERELVSILGLRLIRSETDGRIYAGRQEREH